MLQLISHTRPTGNHSSQINLQVRKGGLAPTIAASHLSSQKTENGLCFPVG